MKKIVRLTESDLVRLVKRVINEQSTDCFQGLKDSFEVVLTNVFGRVLPNGRRASATSENMNMIKTVYQPNFEKACRAFADYVGQNPNTIMGQQEILKNKLGMQCVEGYSLKYGNTPLSQTEIQESANAITQMVVCIKESKGVRQG
jgi:hypothetical protein